jgi:hypothetical protein
MKTLSIYNPRNKRNPHSHLRSVISSTIKKQREEKRDLTGHKSGP